MFHLSGQNGLDGEPDFEVAGVVEGFEGAVDFAEGVALGEERFHIELAFGDHVHGAGVIAGSGGAGLDEVELFDVEGVPGDVDLGGGDDAEEEDFCAEAGEFDGLDEGVGGADGFDDEVCTAAAGDIVDDGLGLVGCGDGVGAHFLGEVEFPLGAGDADDAEAAGDEELDVEEAGDAESDDDGGLVGPDVDEGLGVEAGAEDLDDHGFFVGDSVGDGVELEFVDGDVFGEAAIDLAAHEAAVGAEVALVGEALDAVAAGLDGVEDDAGSFWEAVRSDDLADEFVAHDAGVGDGDGAGGDFDVGAAHAGVGDGDEGFGVAVIGGVGDVDDGDVVGGVDYGCSHLF